MGFGFEIPVIPHLGDEAAGVDVFVTQMWDDWDLKAEPHRRTFDHPERFAFADVSQNNHQKGQTHWDNFQWVRSRLASQPRPINTVKTYGADSGRFGNDRDGLERWWRHLIGGAAGVRFHRPDSGLGFSAKAEASIRAARKLAAEAAFWELSPAQNLLREREPNEAYLTADPGKAYLLYFPNGGSVELDLRRQRGTFAVRWLDLARGDWAGRDSVAGDDWRSITAPAQNHWVALIQPAAIGLSGRAENWPQWRGPRGDGTSLETHLPVHWSATSNVAWTVEVPGTGHASPIVWGDRVFTVSAIPETEDRVLLAFDRRTGRQLWRRTVLHSPFERKHALNSHASSTPATDGERVFTAFLDVREVIVAAHDLDGNQRWTSRPGLFQSMHGFCSSPVLFDDKVIVNCDHDGDGYIVALSRQTGNALWRIERPNKTRSYCPPTFFEAGGSTQMVLSGTLCVTSYDPNNGRLRWIIDGPTEQFVASMVYSHEADLFFMTGGYPDHHLLAIRPDGAGNVTKSHIAWRHNRASYVSYVPSPIAVAGYFLVVSDPGFACCFDARTGELQWQEKVGSHHASLVTANGLVYFLSDDGITTVVRPGPTYQVVARNELGEGTFASPALSQEQIFIRGEQRLHCLGVAR